MGHYYGEVCVLFSELVSEQVTKGKAHRDRDDQSLCLVVKDRWSKPGVCHTVRKTLEWAAEFAKMDRYRKRGVWVLVQKTFPKDPAV